MNLTKNDTVMIKTTSKDELIDTHDCGWRNVPKSSYTFVAGLKIVNKMNVTYIQAPNLSTGLWSITLIYASNSTMLNILDWTYIWQYCALFLFQILQSRSWGTTHPGPEHPSLRLEPWPFCIRSCHSLAASSYDSQPTQSLPALEKIQQISNCLIVCVEELTLSIEIVEKRYDRSNIGAHDIRGAPDRAQHQTLSKRIDSSTDVFFYEDVASAPSMWMTAQETANYSA